MGSLGKMFVLALLCGWVVLGASGQDPVHEESFEQQVHVPYTEFEGLPSNDVQHVTIGREGIPLLLTSAGVAEFREGRWVRAAETAGALFTKTTVPASFATFAPGAEVRAVAMNGEETVIAADTGLYAAEAEGAWKMLLPREGSVRWAPVDVRCVAFDADGQLWFACPQGVGFRETADEWRLFTGAEGLPYNDFTCMAAGPKGVWFGTSNGAIRYWQGDFEFRQGRRWLLDNVVRDIAIDSAGKAWLATAAGLSCIEFQPTTLAEKAAFFLKEIDQYHRRTRLGYVNPAHLQTPGDKSAAIPEASDNDGHFGGLYLAAASLGYAATGNEKLREDAQKAFEALAFLSEVTQGGSHPAPSGFIARAVRPTSGPNPNEQDNAERDRKRQQADKRWKIIEPRWPVDETGEWYWKCDSSSDELDGHFFGFGVYFDRVCGTEEEKEPVRAAVRRIADHLLEHNYRLIDHDGRPTRWTYLATEDLNGDRAWWVERGLNSLSLLTYLSVTHHITGDQKYRDAYLELAIGHSYAMNGMTQPKFQWGKSSFGQADDNMAFMNYYHLIRYETDPELLNMYYQSIFRYWNIEKYERNPFFNFVYAACCQGKVFSDQWRDVDVSPTGHWLEESLDSLRRYPLDLVDWPLSNAHRIDMVRLPEEVRLASGMSAPTGCRVDGKVFRIDEQHALYWGDDPWVLSHGGDGTRLQAGVPYLLAYYLGRVHGFITG